MPFILPYQRTKISSSTRFSKYKNVDESAFFLLQKLKQTFRSPDNPTYRIITQHHPYYEIANGMDLDELRENWDYLINHLPKILPTHLSPRARQTWFIAHFTQLALETGGATLDENTPGSFPFSIMPEQQEDTKDGEASANESNAKTATATPGEPASPAATVRVLEEKKTPASASASASASNNMSLPNLPPYRAADRARERMARRGAKAAAADKPSPSFEPTSAPLSSQSGPSASASALTGAAKSQPAAELYGGSVWFLAMLVFNASVLVLRDARGEVFSMALTAFNVVLFFLLFLGKPMVVGLVFREGTRKVVAPVRRRIVADEFSNAGRLAHGQDSPMMRPLTLNKTISGDNFAKGGGQRPASASGSDERGASSPRLNLNLRPAQHALIPMGSTIAQVAPDKLGPATWCTVDSSTFNVRCGPNYKKNKLKKSSGNALYECVGVDAFLMPSGKLDHIAQHIAFPSMSGRQDSKSPESKSIDGGLDRSAEHVPFWFVVNLQVPNYEPANPIWGTALEDGPGFTCVMYFALKPETRRELYNPDAPASIKLLKRFFEARNNDEEQIRKRLKCIPRIANADDLPLGSVSKQLVRTYNAKPFMTGPRCHTFYRGAEYMEVDIDIHRFCYLARKGGHGFMDDFKSMIVDIGFVVEAHGDDEMPEQLLGGVRLSKLNPQTVQTLKYWMQKASSTMPPRLGVPSGQQSPVGK